MSQYFKIIIFLIYFITNYSIFSNPEIPKSEWIEDSFQVRFEFPRAWFKKVIREKNLLIVEFSKQKSIILRFEALNLNKTIELDRFIENQLENLLNYYPDLKVLKEVSLHTDTNGFHESRILLIRYTEQNVPISSRLFFARFENIYYIGHTKVIAKKFPEFKNEINLFLKSIQKEDNFEGRWRNDSIDYISNNELIQYIENLNKNQNYSTLTDINSSISDIKYKSAPSTSNRYINDIEPGQNPQKKEILPVDD